MFRLPKRLPARRARLAALLFALAPIVSACNDGGDPPFSPSPVSGLTVDDIAVSVDAGDVAGILRTGLAPAAANGPQVQLIGNQSIVNGGTLSVAISADAPFTKIYMYVAVPAEGIAATTLGAVDGFFELQFPASQTSATALLTFPQDIPLDEFELRVAAASPDDVVGPFEGLPVSVIRVGTGDVQVTLSWDTDADVDLHVVAPNGAEVYYANPAAAGGELDLDSNAGCSIDGVRNENVTWPTGQAPAGTYTVRVDYWSSCGVSRTNYTIRINNGGNVQVLTGSFTGSGDGGGLGSGVTIATFNRSTGPSITAEAAPVVPSTLKSAAPHAFK
ncbi:MAG: YfaP family protein [Vicinamibacterales bacterium]